MAHRLGVATAALAAIWLSAAAVQAADPAVVCSGKRAKCARTAVGGLLKCHAKAEKKGEVVDAACVAKATDKFGSCMAKAEAKNGCAVNGIAATLGPAIDTFVEDDIVSALDSFYPDPIPGGGNVCSSKKKGCVAKLATAFLDCHAKALKTAAAIDPACWQDAMNEFDGGAAPAEGCFEKLETTGTCLTENDTSAIEATVELFVEDIACQIDASLCPPECGDDVWHPGEGEECDGPDASACGGLQCELDCTCAEPACGDDVWHPGLGEECDGADAANCGAEPCLPNCECLVPCSTCPDKVRVSINGGIGLPCSTNGDCAVGLCDTGLGRCRTDTEIDFGWTGFAFDIDIVDDFHLDVGLDCAVGGSPGPCGDCDVTLWSCDAGNCRCQNDNRIPCSEAFAIGGDCNPGVSCIPWIVPPLGLSPGGTPVCIANYSPVHPTGTYNVDDGSADGAVTIRSVIHLGGTVPAPCPYCTGDPVAGDGMRGGTCVDGKDDGLACDVDGENRSFPAPGGDGTSFDCFPSPSQNISGAGVLVEMDPLRTGSVSLPFGLSCGFGSFTCPCRTCSGDTSIACANDATCFALGAGTCASAQPFPNQCENAVCNPTGVPAHAPDGECDGGPYDQFCDAIVMANGGGIFACLDDDDCDPGVLGVDAGNCTILRLRECFEDPIVATGSAAPGLSRLVARMCVPPTASGSINSVVGLVGPARLNVVGSTEMTCSNNPGQVYVPGSGF